jgi:hypothetical protein
MSEQQFERLLETTGLQRAEVRIRDDIDWSQYLKAGVIVKLSVHTCQWATATTLDDLGIRAESEAERKAIEETQILGYDYILPKRLYQQQQKIRNEGTSLLESRKYSLPTSWGRFIPEQAFREWARGNEEIRQKYVRFAEYLRDNWDDLVREQRDYFIVRGRANYRRLKGIGVDMQIPPGMNEEDAISWWASRFAQRKMAKLQPRDLAFANHRYEWTTEYVPIDQAVASVVDEMLANENPMVRDVARTLAEQQKQGPTQLAEELTGALRTRVYNVVTDCLTALKKNNGDLPGNSVAQLNRLVDEINRIKFWPDGELEQRTEELRQLIAIPGDQRDDGDVKQILLELGRETRHYLLEIDRPPERSAADLGIPDELTLLAEYRERGYADLLVDTAPIPLPTERGRDAGPQSLAV